VPAWPQQHGEYWLTFTAVGVQTACLPDNCPDKGFEVKVGTTDFIDLINDSIYRFTWNDKVGAMGTMKCWREAISSPVPVVWGLYHTDTSKSATESNAISAGDSAVSVGDSAISMVETATSKRRDSPDAIFFKGDSINDCDSSSFENHSTGGSPLVEDCQQLTNNIAGCGHWEFQAGSQHQLAQYNSCAFGVETYCFVRRIWAREISFFVPRARDVAHLGSGPAQSLLRICSGQVPFSARCAALC